jgi:hypothetical protein
MYYISTTLSKFIISLPEVVTINHRAVLIERRIPGVAGKQGYSTAALDLSSYLQTERPKQFQ